MEAESIPVWDEPENLSRLQMVCEWCGTDVLLEEGEFCGVCIDCGMVMFRDGSSGLRGAPGPDDRPAARCNPRQPVTS